jgi:predicted NBD/HSP70 family sugar kinase
LLAARVKIVQAKCGDDAGLLGAARLAYQTGLQDFQDSQDVV